MWADKRFATLRGRKGTIMKWTGLWLVLGMGLFAGCSDETTQLPAGDVTSNLTDTAGTSDSDAGGDSSAQACEGAAEGAVCDDGDPCTRDDVCTGGICLGGSNDPCATDNPCATGTCVAGEGCQYESAPDGATCTLSCFGEATCVAGTCQAQADSQVECPLPGPDQPCVSELSCDPQTGACTLEISKPEGTTCDTDSDLCAIETCDGAGSCEATVEVNSCATEKKNDPCQLWQCNKKTGSCNELGFAGEISCDDGNPCTEADMCTKDEFSFILCKGSPIPVDDKNACTNDSCDEGVILHEPIDGKPCETTDPCSPDGLCEVGLCKPTTSCACTLDSDCPQPENKCLGVAFCDSSGAMPVCALNAESLVVCEAIDASCEVNDCVPETGQCVVQPLADGVVCNDGNACTLSDSCTNGVCQSGANLTCDDDLFCNGTESCDANLGCQVGDAPSLDDGVACTTDSCDEAVDQAVHTPEDAPCDNGLYCDGTESCDANLGCQPGAAPEVDDAVACTLDSCDEAQDVVVHDAQDALCDNAKKCDGVETCDVAVGCVAGEPSPLCTVVLRGYLMADGFSAPLPSNNIQMRGSLGAPRFIGQSVGLKFKVTSGLPPAVKP